MQKQPNVKAWLANLQQPMPIRVKARTVTRNLFRRLILLQTCCGHPGEPGC